MATKLIESNKKANLINESLEISAHSLLLQKERIEKTIMKYTHLKSITNFS